MGSATRSGRQDLRFKVASVLAEEPNNDLRLDEYTVSVEQPAAAVRAAAIVRDEPGCPESNGSAAAANNCTTRPGGRDLVDGNEGNAASNGLLRIIFIAQRNPKRPGQRNDGSTTCAKRLRRPRRAMGDDANDEVRFDN